MGKGRIQIIQDSNSVYHGKKTYASASGLKIIYNQSPAHFIEWLNTPFKKTEALHQGSAFHYYLESDKAFKEHVYIFNEDDRPRKTDDKGKEIGMKSPVNQAWKKELEEKFEVITPEFHESIKLMYNKLHSNELIRSLMVNGKSEASIYHEFMGVECKLRIDLYSEFDDVVYITDWKSARDANKNKFGKAATENDLPIQAAFYHDIIKYITGKRVVFYFAAIEKVPPYAYNIFAASEKTLELGRIMYTEALEKYKKCKKENYWPSYEDENELALSTLVIPDWYFFKNGAGHLVEYR